MLAQVETSCLARFADISAPGRPSGMLSRLMSTGDPTGSLVRAFFELRKARRSGVLSVAADEVTTSVHFREGLPVWAEEEGTPGEALGRMLVRTRVLTAQEHSKVIDKMATSLENGQKFGEIAIELGLLTQAKLEHALREQVRWRIVRALQREGVHHSFREASIAARGAGLPLESLVLDAARWLRPEQRLGVVEAARGKFPVLSSAAVADVAARFALTAEDEPTLAIFDGSVALEDLVKIEPSAAGTDVGALCVALYAAGELELADAARAASRGSLRPLSRPPSRPPPSERVARTLARLKKARAKSALLELPGAVAERKPASEHEARVIAEQAFQHGVLHLRANRLEAAVPLLRRAFGLMPKNIEYELYAMWTEVRVHEGKPTAPQLGALRHIALSAVRQDPNLAFAYYVLGQVTLYEGGSESMAKHHFVHALKLDPDAIDAERHVRVLRRREARGSRVPQVRTSRAPAVPPPAPSAPVARVALKKVLSHAPRPGSDATETPVVLYRKPQRTLEMSLESPPPPDVEVAQAPAPPTAAPSLSPSASLANAAAVPVAQAVPVGPVLDGAQPADATSLTGVARPKAGGAEDQGPPSTERRPAPKKPQNTTTLVAGAAMTLAVLAAAFAMLGLRASGSVVKRPPPVASFVAPAARPPAAVSVSATPLTSPAPPLAIPSTPAVTSTASASARAIVPDAGAPVVASADNRVDGGPAGRSENGLVVLPKWASQRRIYVDGKLATNGGEQLEVKCGSRQVQIGSSGKPRTLEVPCGGIATW